MAISKNPWLVAVAPTKIRAWSLSPILPRTSSTEPVPATVLITALAVAALPLIDPLIVELNVLVPPIV